MEKMLGEETRKVEAALREVGAEMVERLGRWLVVRIRWRRGGGFGGGVCEDA